MIQSIKLYLHRKEKFYGLSFSEWGFIPQNKSLYALALLHRSASLHTKSGAVLNYERLEFLGDAVLGAIVAEIVYKFFPNKDEGFMTQLRSRIVSRAALNDIAVQMGLDKEVVAHSDLSKNKHIYGDVFDENYIFPHYVDIPTLVNEDHNYKSRLIEWAQKNKIQLTINTEPTNWRRTKFICSISINSKILGQGVGTSKKEAEQKSAAVVLRKIEEKKSQGKNS